jgi:hypothetical protein
MEIELEMILEKEDGGKIVLDRLKGLMKDIAQSLTFEDDVVFKEDAKLVKAANEDLKNYAKNK